MSENLHKNAAYIYDLNDISDVHEESPYFKNAWRIDNNYFHF